MKISRVIFAVLALWVVNVFSLSAARTIYTVNDAWRFVRGNEPAAVNDNFDDSSWSVVSVPHTWNDVDAADEVPGYYRGVGWYRKSISLKINGTRTYIRFEGANQETELFVNGKSAGSHRGGYSAFTIDITPFVKEGDNLLAVKVDNSHNRDIAPLSADFTFFGGIYRDIYVVRTPQQHIATTHYGAGGVYINTPSVNARRAEVVIRTMVENHQQGRAKLSLKSVVVAPDGTLVKEVISPVNSPNGRTEVVQQLTIADPLLWDTQSPHLYKVYTSLLDSSGSQIDGAVNPLGLRWYSFDPDRGFMLNGRHVKLMGTNRHQDYHKMGNALPDEMHIRDVMLLKQMGGNILRIAHYPQDPLVLQMCDKLGIVASIEIPVVNAVTPTQAFNDNCIEQAREMVWQNYNHPSLVIWAYMNEVMLRPPYDKADTVAQKEYFAVVERVATNIENEIRSLDKERYTMLPCHGNAALYQAVGIAKLPRILGWNLYQGWYGGRFSGFDDAVDEIHKRFPAQAHIITEYGADVDPRLHSFDSQRFDFSAEYGDLYHEHYLKAIMARPFIAGATIWNLNDFYSESRRDAVPNVNNKGITGTDRELKDSYILYKARFNPSPMVRIGSHNWLVRGGVADSTYSCTQSVKVYSNGSSVTLSLNGKVLASRDVVDNIALFEVPFVDGPNRLDALSLIAGQQVRDVLNIDFRMVAPDLRDAKMPFRELNIMFGSKRYYEDRKSSMVWLPEREYTPGGWGYVGGQAVLTKTRHGALPASDIDVLGTTDDPIFQTQRRGLEAVRFDLPDGEYALYLYFAELNSSAQGEVLAYNLGNDAIRDEASQRVFGISVNGVEVLPEIDLARQYGEHRAVTQKVMVDVRGGRGVNVEFKKIVAEPVINAIRLVRIY